MGISPIRHRGTSISSAFNLWHFAADNCRFGNADRRALPNSPNVSVWANRSPPLIIAAWAGLGEFLSRIFRDSPIHLFWPPHTRGVSRKCGWVAGWAVRRVSRLGQSEARLRAVLVQTEEERNQKGWNRNRAATSRHFQQGDSHRNTRIKRPAKPAPSAASRSSRRGASCRAPMQRQRIACVVRIPLAARKAGEVGERRGSPDLA